MRGARWVQERLLDRYDDPSLKVYAVWFSMVRGDKRSAFNPRLLTDPRVTHLWDEEKIVGRWFGENFELEGCDNEVLWDAFFVFGPDAVWMNKPGPLENCGFPIFKERRTLHDCVKGLLGS